MTSHEPEDLTRLLSDAVQDIEPRSGIEAIRSRTTTKESPMATSRNWIFGAFGAAAATAAVITAVVVVGNDDDNGASPEPQPGITSTPTVTGKPSEGPTETTAPPAELGTVPVYYVGDTAAGLGLYREFHQAEISGDNGTLESSVREAVLGNPLDRDYTSYWTQITESVDATWNGDVITIDLNGALGALHDGTTMTPQQREISVQQLIYAAQAGLGQGRVPVQFLITGNHTDQILGQPASEPLSNGPVLEVNSHVQLSNPNEGDVVSGDTLEFSGVGNSFEANLGVRLQRWEGTEIVYQGSVMTEGWMEAKLFPFSGSIDISDVPPGQYVLMVMEDDPSGGAEGDGPDTDTRVITIQ